MAFVNRDGASPFLPPPLLIVQLNFNSERAQSFLWNLKPTLEGVESQGEHLLMKVNPDGNCFLSAAVVGGILCAVCQPGSGAIQGVLDRFQGAIRSSGRTAYAVLSKEQKVGVSIDSTPTVSSAATTAA